MYVYIMQRTQIYLTAKESSVLDRVARATGHTRSQLIRNAIGAVYLEQAAPDAVERALRATAGSWGRKRPTGAGWVERRRRGRLAKLHGTT